MAAVAGLSAKKKLTPHDRELGSLPFRLPIPYSIGIAEAVGRGKYDYVDPSVLKYFDCGRQPSGYVIAHLLQESSFIQEADLMRRMHGLRFAHIEELLAFGAKYPEAQRHGPIVALAQKYRIGQLPGVWQTPYLAGNIKERKLALSTSDVGWGNEFRFLVIALPLRDRALTLQEYKNLVPDY